MRTLNRMGVKPENMLSYSSKKIWEYKLEDKSIISVYRGGSHYWVSMGCPVTKYNWIDIQVWEKNGGELFSFLESQFNKSGENSVRFICEEEKDSSKYNIISSMILKEVCLRGELGDIMSDIHKRGFEQGNDIAKKTIREALGISEGGGYGFSYGAE